jgi:two-component system response regulator (stage 0 sporulation protein F)
MMKEKDEQKHILIADDEPDILQILDIIIKKTNTKVSKAETGTQALNIIDRDKTVDLVITDIKMPGLDGIQLLREIKDRNIITPPVIMITGFSNVNVDELYDMGACGYIAKPFDWDDIIKNILDALRDKPRFHRPHFNEANIKASLDLKYDSPYQAIWTDKDLLVGQGGMFVKTNNFFTDGDLTRFNIEFTHGEPKHISGIGEILWQREEKLGNLPVGMGIKFIHLPKEVEEFVEHFITEHGIRAYVPRG